MLRAGSQHGALGEASCSMSPCPRLESLVEHSPLSQRHGWHRGMQPSPTAPPFSRGDVHNPQPPAGVCLQSPLSLWFAGQEPISVLGLILGLGLALLILVLFGYAFVRCYQQGRCWRREYGQSAGTGTGGAGREKERGCRAWGVGSTSCRSPKSTCWIFGCSGARLGDSEAKE